MKRTRSIEGTIEGFDAWAKDARRVEVDDFTNLPPVGTKVILTWEEEVSPHKCDKMPGGWEWQWKADGLQDLCYRGAYRGTFPRCPFCGEPVEGNDA